MKNQPTRTCMGCNEKKAKNDLIRIVKNKNDEINIDRTGKLDGRGAYICDNIQCLEKIIKSKRLEKIFDKEISNEIYEKLGLIGLSAKARKISFGSDSVEDSIKNRKVTLIIVAEDSSERTKDKFKYLSEKYKVPIIIIGKIEELSKAIGKSNKAILGIEDINLSKEIQKINNGGEVIG